MNTITSKTLKELRPALKENGYCKSEKAWCAKSPKPVNLDSYSSFRDTLLADWMVRFLPLKRQEIVRFCKAIDSILHYEQCKTTPNNGTCDGVKKTTLYRVHRKCDRKVLKKHKQAQKDRAWLWAKIVALVTAIVAALIWFMRPFWNNPGDGKDDDKGDKGWRKWRPAFQTAKANFKAARGFKAKMRALVNGVGQVYQAWRVPVLTPEQQAAAEAMVAAAARTSGQQPSGQTATADVNGQPTTTNGAQTTGGVPAGARQPDINVQRAAVIVEDRWPQTHDALHEAQYHIDHFLHGLHETDFPQLRDDLEAASLHPLVELPAEADIDDLREALFGNWDSLGAFEETVSVLQEYMLPMVTGHVASRQRTREATDDLTSMELVDRTWEAVYRYLHAVNALQAATGLVREITGTIGSVFSVDPELNDAWRNVIDRARALLRDVDDIVSSYMSVFEQGHIRDTDKAIWVDIDERAFDLHELSTAEELIKTIESLLRGRALENDVTFNIPEHFKHIAVPEEQRFALLLIAYSRAKDSIDFRCPDREGEDPFVQMWAKIDGDYATLHIIDNGRGILNIEEAKKRGTSLRYAFKLAEKNGMTMHCQPRWIPNEYYGLGEESKVSAGTEFQIRFRLGDNSDTPQGTPSSSGSAVGSDGYNGIVPQNMAPLASASATGGIRFMGR